MSTQKPSIFTEQEYLDLMVASIPTGGYATETQMLSFIKICEEMKIEATLLEAIQSGKIVVASYQGDEPIFKNRPPNLTP